MFYLKARMHFTGEVHWFPSTVSGTPVPENLTALLQRHVKDYGWNEPVVEEKTTGSVTTAGYEALMEVLNG